MSHSHQKACDMWRIRQGSKKKRNKEMKIHGEKRQFNTIYKTFTFWFDNVLHFFNNYTETQLGMNI